MIENLVFASKSIGNPDARQSNEELINLVIDMSNIAEKKISVNYKLGENLTINKEKGRISDAYIDSSEESIRGYISYVGPPEYRHIDGSILLVKLYTKDDTLYQRISRLFEEKGFQMHNKF